MTLMREHLHPYFLFETRASEANGFWPPLNLHNEQTNDSRWYEPTIPDKGWSFETGLVEEAMDILWDDGEWERWPETIEVVGVFKNGVAERQPYRLGRSN
jgi:hypothetical protein